MPPPVGPAEVKPVAKVMLSHRHDLPDSADKAHERLRRTANGGRRRSVNLCGPIAFCNRLDPLDTTSGPHRPRGGGLCRSAWVFIIVRGRLAGFLIADASPDPSRLEGAVLADDFRELSQRLSGQEHDGFLAGQV